MNERILVPIDFSPHADWAFDIAVAWAKKLQAELLLVHVRSDTSLNPLAYTAEAESETRRALEGYLKRAQDAGLEGEMVLVHGVPWRQIVELARSKHATLIIMGTHGRSGIAHALLGSVAERVAHHAPCPVQVTRRPADTPQTETASDADRLPHP